jgi:hypothetical protein
MRRLISPPRDCACLPARLLASLCCLLASLAPSWAQEAAPTADPRDPLSWQVSSPLARSSASSGLAPGAGRPLTVVAKFGRWFPLAVTLSNQGEAAQVSLSVKLLASAPANEPGATSTFETSVALPANGRKRVWLYARLERGESDTGEVTLSGRGVASRTFRFALASPDEGARVLLTVSDSEERFAFLSSGGSRARGVQGAPSRIEPLSCAREWLPPRATGLDGVDCVVLHDFAHSALAPEQVAALRGYVGAGGTLLVLGGSNWQRLSASPLREMWPLSPSRSERAGASDVSALVSAARLPLGPGQVLSGADRLGGAPLLVSRGEAHPDSRPVGSELPSSWALWRSWGAGRVLWLAFDPSRPPFLGWRGQDSLWRRVLGAAASVQRLEGVDSRLGNLGYVANGSVPTGFGYSAEAGPPSALLRSELARAPQMRTPPASSISWFLALYVFFLVPVNYVVLRLLDRREWAWVSVPLIVLVFSGLSYAAAVRIKGTQVRLRLVNVVQGSGESPLARADAMLWLFSPRKSTVTVSAQGTSASPTDVPSADLSAAVYADGQRGDSLDGARVVQDAEGAARVEAPLNMWDFKTFVAQGAVGAGAGLRVQGSGAARRLANRTPWSLRKALWIEGGRALVLGDLAPGDSASLGSGNWQAAPNLLAASARELSPPEGLFAFGDSVTGTSIASAALSAALGASTSQWAPPTLVAWGQKPTVSLRATDVAQEPQSVTLFVWRFAPR